MGIAQRRAAAGLGLFEVIALEQVGGAVRAVVVELVEQHDVGSDALQHCGDPARTVVAGFEASHQAAGGVVVERGVVGRDAQRAVDVCRARGVRRRITVHANAARAGQQQQAGEKGRLHASSPRSSRRQPRPVNVSSGR